MSTTYRKPGYSDFSFETILLGLEGVGRSAFLARLTRNAYEPNIPPTIGVECTVYKTKVQKRKIHTLIFDTSGQKRYEAARELCYSRAAGAIVLYDVSRRVTFSSVKSAIEKFRARAPGAVIMICAAKIDKPNKEVTTEEGLELAKSMNVLFHETSAMEDLGVKDAFASFAKAVCRKAGPLVYCARCARRKHDIDEPCSFA